MRHFPSLVISFALLMSSQLAIAADTDYNGRWDLIVHKTPADKAWWLEITGAGTPALKGVFSGSPDGLEPIQKPRIENGVLRWSYDRPASEGRGGRAPIPALHAEYEAKLVNGKLEGKSGDPQKPWAFTGERAPEIKEHDDATWIKGKPVQLFNGKDLAGWIGVSTGNTNGWTVENGVLMTHGKGENIATKQKFWNFELHAEFKVEATNSNSGIGLRGRYEVQIINDYGRAEPGLHGMGALYHRIPPSVNAGKPPGEWQAFDIRLVGREVTTVLNGISLYEKGVIDGMTGSLPFDPYEGQPGPIELQGDHATVSFRNIVLRPLTKSK